MSLIRFTSIFLFISLFSGCVTPHPGERDAMIQIPFEQEVAWGEQAYREILKDKKISQDRQLIKIVQRVGNQLAAVSPQPNLKWQFLLIEADKMEAFALPGGKVAITTGTLPICANEAGLAALMSHQIAHTLARHGTRRMPTATSVGLTDHKYQKAVMEAWGVGTPVGLTQPFSHSYESEADEIGMLLMAKAGYDPREAERFWARAHTMSRGPNPPGIISTHPIDAMRIQGIRQLFPRAKRIYQTNPLKHGLGESFLYILSRRHMNPNSKKPSPPAHRYPDGSAPLPGTP